MNGWMSCACIWPSRAAEVRGTAHAAPCRGHARAGRQSAAGWQPRAVPRGLRARRECPDRRGAREAGASRGLSVPCAEVDAHRPGAVCCWPAAPCTGVQGEMASGKACLPPGHAPHRHRHPGAAWCRAGFARRAQVADHLARQGFQSVFNVAGGITAFSQRVDTSVPVY